MPSHEFLKVHHYRRVPGTSEVQLLRKTPYKMFVSQGQPACFIREGKAFSEEGELFEGGIPGWVMEQLKLMKAKDLAKLGFKKEELDPDAPAESKEATKAPAETKADEDERTEEAVQPEDSGFLGDVQGVNSPLADRRARRSR